MNEYAPAPRRQQISVLTANTAAFTICFAVWVMFGVIGNPIADELDLSETQFGVLTALPVLTGSLLRVPIGIWGDRFGGRPVFALLMLGAVIPVYLVQFATAYWQLLILGAFVGMAGASFSVGIAYTARFFERERQGFAMGIFGAGNAGAALTNYVAPTLVVWFGWQFVPTVYALMLTVTVALFWLFTYPEPPRARVGETSLRDQFAMLKDPKVWKYGQYYSVVFGGYVALSLYLTRYYVMEYEFGLQTAAVIATIFVLPSGVIRAFGGWLSDRFGAHTVTWWCMWSSFVCLFVMSYPYTEYAITQRDGGTLEFAFGVNVWLFTLLLFIVGIAWGIGKASVFKYISDEYDRNIGLVSGIVGLLGGVAGFLLPIMFGALVDLTGVSSTAFMLLFGVTGVSLIWMWWTERRQPLLTRDDHRSTEEHPRGAVEEGA